MPETDNGTTRTEAEGDVAPSASNDAEVAENVASGGSVKTTLASAGHSLEGAESELVLNPLRLAFETKSPKIIELALDCLHVCQLVYFVCSGFMFITLFMLKLCKCRNSLHMII